ncbi:LysR family transcriptional regulator [Pararhizobium haloflavum]|uniref:LysR family transcriptional regulator n=1 Tax=Pararhizobium haloflavum TaxID=2037914 RepID=UPI001FDF9788|nr:LysR substrate-binding domain-containing protein [Pararhizobium haloflavum]
MIGSPHAGDALPMDMDWLQDFLTLARERHFSRAAESRHVSQPAFSRRIRALEDWAGTSLFERGSQGATLTAAGEALAPVAEAVVGSLGRARRDIQAIGAQNGGEIAIAATHALSFTFFPGWIRRHLRLDAFGALSLVSDSMEGCERIMLAGEVDFLLCYDHEKQEGLFSDERFESLVIGTDRLIAVCAPDAQGRALFTLADRRGKTLSYSQSSGLGRILAVHAAAQGGDMASEPLLTSHLAATLMTMAREGHGIAWLPVTLAADDLDNARLVRAGDAAADVPLQIKLFRPSTRRSAAAERLWADLVSGQGVPQRQAAASDTGSTSSSPRAPLR